MTSEAPQFIPLKKPDAGTPIGIHYINEFIKCPRRWFFRNYQALADESTGELINVGIEPREIAPALLTGSIFHTALEEYYRSGIVDGEDTGNYQLEPALDAMRVAWNKRQESYANEEDAEVENLMVQSMIIAYFDRFGPSGASPDYPRIKVLCDSEGSPFIEREFITDLGYKGYYLTSKIDLIVNDQGYVKAMEHKTSVASYVQQRISSIHYDSQFTAEIFTLKENLPTDLKLFGVMINVVQKNRSARSKYHIAERDTTNRTQDQLNDFSNSVVDTLRQIDERVAAYEDWLSKGVEPHIALATWFPVHGQFNEQCFAYRRPCDYYVLCKMPEKANINLQGPGFKARVKPESEIKEQ